MDRRQIMPQYIAEHGGVKSNHNSTQQTMARTLTVTQTITEHGALVSSLSHRIQL
jgi:hypothetical protein